MRIKHTIWTLLLAMIISLASGASVYAQFQPDACDPMLWESFKARSTLMSQREITQNQNHVFKPDSILEYMCFDQFYKITGVHIAPIMSERQDWGPLRPVTATDSALERVTGTTLTNYLFMNFDHTYLGGRLDPAGGAANVPHGYYLCDAMAYVWSQAKCWNFMTDDHDGFFSFAQYASLPDARQLPNPCVKDNRWAGLLMLAQDDPPWYPPFENLTQNIVFPTVQQRLMHNFCSGPIPAGIQVQRLYKKVTPVPATRLPPFPDGICTNPGCMYDGIGCVPN